MAYRWAASPSQNMEPSDIAPPLLATRNGEPAVGIRRFTPVECERLQGFADDYTRVPFGKRGKVWKDSHRYEALGNSKAVPVIRWIGARIALVDAQTQHHEAAA